MTFNRLLFIAPATVALAALALSRSAPGLAQNAPAASTARGAVIAAQGTPAGAPGCSRCHAFDGSSDGSGAFPRIAGQSAYYLSAQLGAFASGAHDSSVMSPIARALTAQDISDVSAYYAGLNPPFLPLAAPDPALVKTGEELAKTGNEPRGIQACDNCHGPSGVGEPPAIPYLAGQYATYIARELDMWQQGFRKTSPSEMTVVAKALNDQEIAALAAYYQQARGGANVETSQ